MSVWSAMGVSSGTARLVVASFWSVDWVFFSYQIYINHFVFLVVQIE